MALLSKYCYYKMCLWGYDYSFLFFSLWLWKYMRIQLPSSPVQSISTMLHSKKKSTSKHQFLVLQLLVTNIGLYSLPARTKWYLEALWQAYWDFFFLFTVSIWTPICLSWCFQIPFGPSRYWIESFICDNLKHQIRFFLWVQVSQIVLYCRDMLIFHWW